LRKEFLVVNSFAAQAFGGNPAAVLPDASGLTDTQMQAIARQLNLVETVFVLPAAETGADLRFRYFTPVQELPVAGHPTVAAVLALIEQGRLPMAAGRDYRIRTGAGIQRVTVARNERGPVVVMEQPRPEFLPPLDARAAAAGLFGLRLEDLLPDLPVQPVHTGLGHLIVPLRTLEALFRAERRILPLKSFCAGLGIREAQLFTPETLDPQKDLHTRNICPREGLEDPGCGVGNGALGAYLLRHYYRGETAIRLRAEQGNIVNMPCVIEIHAQRSQDGIRVSIGGNGRLMIRGEFYLDQPE
jgi:trans-2,3-dihydro-3-hydroxyanthranilate isomerase